MIVNVNDTSNCDSIEDNLPHLHEKLQQGSMQQGLSRPKTCGIITSANLPEAKR